MGELIDIYTEDGKKIDTLAKNTYYSMSTPNVPWIKCCTCFVIDEKQKKVLFEKRGKCFLDPGKLDLCSGHVQSGETCTQTMVRELREELGIQTEEAINIHSLGELKIDYTRLKNRADQKYLKAFVSVYALKMKDISKIEADKREADSIGWLNLEDTLGFVSNNMTRIPYDEELEKDYMKIFENLKNYIYPQLIESKINISR